MYHDLTKGSISRSLLLFALSMIAGNMLQQLYNIVDSVIVGKYVGAGALAAVGATGAATGAAALGAAAAGAAAGAAPTASPGAPI